MKYRMQLNLSQWTAQNKSSSMPCWGCHQMNWCVAAPSVEQWSDPSSRSCRMIREYQWKRECREQGNQTRWDGSWNWLTLYWHCVQDHWTEDQLFNTETFQMINDAMVLQITWCMMSQNPETTNLYSDCSTLCLKNASFHFLNKYALKISMGFHYEIWH